MCLARVVRKLDFWRPHLRGTPVLVLQIVLNFVFLLNLLILKTYLNNLKTYLKNLS